MRTHLWCAAVGTVAVLFSSFLYCAALAGSIHDAAKAGDRKEVDRLITAGTDVDERDISDKTALHWAADAAQVEVVQLLVEKGAGVNAKDFRGWGVLSAAVLAGDRTIVETLIDAGADVNYGEGVDITPLNDATRMGYTDIVAVLKRHGARCGTNAEFSC